MLNKVMTIKEASQRWGLDRGTLLKACKGQRGYEPIFTKEECRQSGSTWLITYEAMERVYGMEKTNV